MPVRGAMLARSSEATWSFRRAPGASAGWKKGAIPRLVNCYRKALRKEVGFGCPVKDCGNPYLTWHHFDPPWEIAKHKPKPERHKVEGIIALCHSHHDEADAGAFTKEQLHALKR
jgi:hypothetical protein